MKAEPLLLEHAGGRPVVHADAYVAPTAVLCGNVRIGPGCTVGFGAVLSAEDGAIELVENVVVMETAVIKASRRAPVRIGRNVLIGPRAYLTGCTIGDDVFLATGSTVFNGAVVGRGAEVRINGVVHLSTRVPEDATVPIGWVAVGDPAQILPPDEHDRIWALQQPLNFPKVVFGLDRPPPGGSIMPELVRRYAKALRTHREDRAVT
jgi:carbonic anhydrase/acetyltransferase-like protein (isoleucine patch superfamily)